MTAQAKTGDGHKHEIRVNVRRIDVNLHLINRKFIHVASRGWEAGNPPIWKSDNQKKKNAFVLEKVSDGQFKNTGDESKNSQDYGSANKMPDS